MADTHAKHHDYHLVDPSPWPAVGARAFITAVGLIIWMRSARRRRALGPQGPVVLRRRGLASSTRCSCGGATSSRRRTAATTLRSSAAPALRHDHVHRLRGDVLRRLVLGLLRRRAVPAGVPIDVTAARRLCRGDQGNFGMVQRDELFGGHWPPKPARSPRPTATSRHFRSLGAAARQHADPAHVGHDRDVGAPRAAREQPQGARVGPGGDGDPRHSCSPPAKPTSTCHAGFNYAGHIYGSTFFMATGFHGAHVIIGTLFLTSACSGARRHFTPKQHFGFEAAAWYWHFVDVVWLFLFIAST